MSGTNEAGEKSSSEAAKVPWDEVAEVMELVVLKRAAEYARLRGREETLTELKRKIEAIDREIEQAQRKLGEREETLTELKRKIEARRYIAEAETVEKAIELCKREGVLVVKGTVTGKGEIRALGSSKELIELAKALNRPVIWREREGDLLIQNGVTTHVLSMRKEFAEAGEEVSGASIEERLQAYRAELDELDKLRGEGAISEETYAERKRVLEEKIASTLLE